MRLLSVGRCDKMCELNTHFDTIFLLTLTLPLMLMLLDTFFCSANRMAGKKTAEHSAQIFCIWFRQLRNSMKIDRALKSLSLSLIPRT